MRLIALVLLVTAAPSFAADQFDWVCQGTKISPRGAAAQPATVRVHVDLAAKKWCTDTCRAAQDIKDVTPDRITFAETYQINTYGEGTTEVYGDRKKKAFSDLTIRVRPEETATYSKTETMCTEAPFTPFPAPRGGPAGGGE